MSEINNIITSSNKFLYSQSELITPVDGVNYFNDTYHLAESYNYTQTMTFDEISFNFTPSDTVRNQIAVCHVYGTITKDIAKSISFYSVNNRVSISTGRIANTLAITANPNSNIDYFDYIWIIPQGYNQIYEFWKTHAADNNMIKASQIQVNMTFDFYCL